MKGIVLNRATGAENGYGYGYYGAYGSDKGAYGAERTAVDDESSDTEPS